MDNARLWQTKVLAYIHDPAEKALILLRGKGHEAGTVAELKQLFGERLAQARQQLDEFTPVVKRADRWAAAADRPSLPKGRGGQVQFAKVPQLIHPLSGERFDLGSLELDIPVAAVESVSLDHFSELIESAGEDIDWKKTFLSFWRFGPNSPAPDLGALWTQLPADTRSPDHTIWEHLSLTSAFAGAMAADEGGQPALLLMSFGPVQGFIAQARSVSDLWAGSHLLSRIAWVAMEEVCDRYGPDAVLFPNLHGVAQVDLWLYGILKKWRGKGKPLWMRAETDENPLFSAALPNRFVALVPASAAEALAQEIEAKVRDWVKKKATSALDQLLKMAGYDDPGDAQKQLEQQFQDFPEVYWATVPWSLAGRDNLDDAPLQEALRRLHAEPRYLPKELEQLVRGEMTLDGVEFYRANPGVAYPGLYEALERVHVCSKTLRACTGTLEEGYRCSLCGEREWLTVNRGAPDTQSGLYAPAGRRGETVWTRVGERHPAIAKKGEHLCGWCALKRLWPRLFTEEIKESIAEMEKRPDRFVLSTHAVALSTSLWRWVEGLDQGGLLPPEETRRLRDLVDELERFSLEEGEARPVALPARLYRQLRKRVGDGDDQLMAFIKRLPSYLDAVEDEQARDRAVSMFEKCFKVKPEAYYALVLMDGDELGAWLSGAKDPPKLAHRFHEVTLQDLQSCGDLKAYLEARRPPSPSWHQAVSTALNSFALDVSRRVVEDLFMGKLIYCGGDDLLAMVSVHDLPALMFALRCVYSGQLPAGQDAASFWRRLDTESELKVASGFALLTERKLVRLMGRKATASIGAVIAHHQAPLGRVLDDLRRAERRAKTEGGRDAFCITVKKRSGGTSHLVGKWNLEGQWHEGDMGLLLDLRDVLAHDVSRRAAYELSQVFRDLPPDEDTLAAVIQFQFQRKAKVEGKDSGEIARRLARRAVKVESLAGAATDGRPAPNRWLRDMVITAEFLAREGRVQQTQ